MTNDIVGLMVYMDDILVCSPYISVSRGSTAHVEAGGGWLVGWLVISIWNDQRHKSINPA